MDLQYQYVCASHDSADVHQMRHAALNTSWHDVSGCTAFIMWRRTERTVAAVVESARHPPSAVSLQWLQQLFHFQGEWGLNSCKLAQKLSFSLRSFLQVSSKTFFTTMNIYCPKKLWAGRIIWGPHRFAYVCFATHWGQDLPHDKWSLALYLTSHLSFSNHIFHYELQFTGNFNTVSVTKCVCGTVHQIPKVGIKCLL